MHLTLKPPALDKDPVVLEQRLLSVPRQVTNHIAGSALRSHALYARSAKNTTRILIPHNAVVMGNNLYGQGKPIPTAVMGVHDQGNVSLMTIYADRSALLWRSQDQKNFTPYPAVFTIKPSAQPHTHQKGALSLLKLNDRDLALTYAITKRQVHALSGDIDTHRLPMPAMAVYVQLVMEMLAWTRDIPKVDLALDIGAPGFCMGALPYGSLSDDQKVAMNAHLDNAQKLITAKIGHKIKAWAGAVYTRGLLQTGKFSAPLIDLKVYNTAHRVDKDLTRRIERAFIAALKHPNAPIPYDDLVCQFPIWNHTKKKVDKSYTILGQHLLWQGAFQEIKPASGHDLMRAYGHFGGPTSIFPT